MSAPAPLSRHPSPVRLIILLACAVVGIACVLVYGWVDEFLVRENVYAHWPEAPEVQGWGQVRWWVRAIGLAACGVAVGAVVWPRTTTPPG